jgi:hypothetical protein
VLRCSEVKLPLLQVIKNLKNGPVKNADASHKVIKCICFGPSKAALLGQEFELLKWMPEDAALFITDLLVRKWHL